MESYERLASAIIIEAVKDYRKAIRFLKHHPHTPELDNDSQQNALRDKVIKNENERDAAERFFRSGWFEMLSSLDGEVLLKKVCEMEVG
ncbi:MAG: hypothetical protein BI182_02420 [Acetobacterium sp. MES1]|uniref:Uncharacterized protein n=1 Tax=Acetobacterium wieringae TaxID=52694 RepID=A0A5D0WR24_9FIRM|nr:MULTISPECIES: hypothetical protein [Acetobacterium]OXS26582.1 MAG: hypothetical protein BI182_02420 [Acetobacterium sp. MES1]TYC86493.1 hypothetical protein FXB42_06445 [Acetobacterium wieringae]